MLTHYLVYSLINVSHFAHLVYYLLIYSPDSGRGLPALRGRIEHKLTMHFSIKPLLCRTPAFGSERGEELFQGTDCVGS